MAKQKNKANKKGSNGANLGFEEKLWQAADKMRGHMDPAEYKHVVLGLIFLSIYQIPLKSGISSLKNGQQNQRANTM